MPIDPSLIDAATPRGGGLCLPRTDRLGATWPIYEDVIDVIPRSSWPALVAEQGLSLQPMVQKIKDQGQEFSCASNACSGGAEVLLTKQFGRENWVELSAISLYKRVASSAGDGSTINDNIREISTRGILPTDSDINKALFAHTHPNTGFSRALPSGWETTATLFKVTEWFDIASMDGFISCILRGAPVFYGRASHAICAVWVVSQGGKYLIKYANSWGDWGEGGFGYDTESSLAAAIGSYGAVAPRSITLWSDDLMPKVPA